MRRVILFLKVLLSWISLPPCPSYGASRPIVDVTFDAPYQQITYSKGDNWTPTWGQDDALYTGSDDGMSFGGIVMNAVAFGKLKGSDPYHLRGTTVNSMRDYREGELFQQIDGYSLGGATFKLGKCYGPTALLESVCISGPSGSKRLFASDRFKSPSFVSMPNEVAIAEFGASPNEYVFAVARAGFIDCEDQYFIGRVPKVKLSQANAEDWTFLDKHRSWVGSYNAAAPVVNARSTDSTGTNWKITSTYSVDGVLYMFVARMDDYRFSGEAKGRQIFRDSSIIKSTDGGRTWTRSATQNRDTPMFHGQRFGAPYFVWYGKDGLSKVDNGDKYVYAISNDGYWESGDNYILGRVLKSRLPDLSAKDWSFYQSGDGMKDESWTHEIAKATPVLSDYEQAGMAGVTYIGGLGRYVMVTWHYPSHGVRDVRRNRDTYTVLEFFEAAHPSGPWTRFKTVKTEGLGWYTPLIGQRFQSMASPSTVHAFIYTTALNMRSPDRCMEEGEWERYQPRYKLNYIPITVSTAPIARSNPTFVGSR